MIFTDLLDMKGIEWRPGDKENEISVCCPFCYLNNETEDLRFRLGINLVKKYAHCFKG